MPQGAKARPSAFGFLTFVEHERLGLIGGYLVLNPLGRPLEFHCSAPIKPTRTQQILYGSTLREFVVGDQLGPALVQKGAKINLLLVDQVEATTIAAEIAAPVVMALPKGNGDRALTPAGESHRLDAPQTTLRGMRTFMRGEQRLALAPTRSADETTVLEALDSFAEGFEFLEPFDRIREAIDEAQRAAR